MTSPIRICRRNTAAGVHDYSDHGATDGYLEEFAESRVDAR